MYYRFAMKALIVPALMLASVGCKEPDTVPPGQTIATLTNSGAVTWLGIANGQLYVAQSGENLSQSLTAIDLKTHAVREIAGQLPGGSLAIRGSHVYVAGYAGEIGEVDLDSGAFERIALIPETISTVAVSTSAYVAAGQRLVKIDKGIASDVPGTSLGGDIGELVVTSSAVFAASHLGKTIVKIADGKTTVVATDQMHPHHLTASADQLVWSVAVERIVGAKLVAMPLAGGDAKVIGEAQAPAQITAVTSDGKHIVCALGGYESKKAGLYAVENGQFRLLARARAAHLAIGTGLVFWSEEHHPGVRIAAAEL